MPASPAVALLVTLRLALARGAPRVDRHLVALVVDEDEVVLVAEVLLPAAALLLASASAARLAPVGDLSAPDDRGDDVAREVVGEVAPVGRVEQDEVGGEPGAIRPTRSGDARARARR